MIAASPVRAILREAALLPKACRGLKENRYTISQSLRYLFLRVFISERGYAAGGSFVTPQGVRLRTRRDFVMYQSLFLFDEYLSSLWRDELAREIAPVIVDVGANLGFFSALCLSICPAARPCCFELVPECAPVIERRMRESGCSDFRVVVGAMGAQDGGTVAIRYEIPYASTNRIGQDRGSHSATVPLIGLDAWCRRNEQLFNSDPFLVKVDVEGAERNVLTGGLSLIRRARWILLELHGNRDALDLVLPTHTVVADTMAPGPEWVCALKRKS